MSGTVASGLTPLHERFREEFSKESRAPEHKVDEICTKCLPLISGSPDQIKNFRVQYKNGEPIVLIEIAESKIEYKTAKMQNGVYTGTLVNGKYHGQGRCEFVNGGTYEGGFKDNKAHGQGIVKYANGDSYEGEFKDGKRNGQGIMKFANKNSYEGGFKDNKAHGQGIMKYANGDSFEGKFKDDKRHGRGIMKYANGDSYEGEWRDGIKS